MIKWFSTGPMADKDGNTERQFGILVEFDTDAEREHLAVLLRALTVHAERQAVYRGNWRRQGWRGNLFKLRLKVERAWDSLWSAELPETDYSMWAVARTDDLVDVINYAAMTVQLINEGDRDGEWRY